MIRMNKTTWLWRGAKTNVLKICQIEMDCIRVSINFNRVKISARILKELNRSNELKDVKSMEFTILSSELELFIHIMEKIIAGTKNDGQKLSIIVWPSGDYVFTRRASAVIRPVIPEGAKVTEM